MMAPSLWEAEPQTPVEALGKVDGTGQALIFVCVLRGVLTSAGVQLLKVWSLVIKFSSSFLV